MPAAAFAADPGDPAPCRRLIKEKWEMSRPLDLEGCLDRLAGSPSPYDPNGYKLALWGDVLLATDGTALYQSADAGLSWSVARQPADVTRAALTFAPSDPPPLAPETPAPAEAASGTTADAASAARYRMWLALARRCEPALPDEGASLRDLQFKASECERRLRLPPGNVSTSQN
ncbi:hypothetical protein DKG74_19745 [Zavarzinia aquatilis]|uniref:Uncharacterized protein n=1 Tax=Zavarzinia aquatilis TaxID=2211142 RepID=A0A317DU23_9PROT|nr:hypothetical protein DKG74_19745 [Zavarzinia aquatilis]